MSSANTQAAPNRQSEVATGRDTSPVIAWILGTTRAGTIDTLVPPKPLLQNDQMSPLFHARDPHAGSKCGRCGARAHRVAPPEHPHATDWRGQAVRRSPRVLTAIGLFVALAAFASAAESLVIE